MHEHHGEPGRVDHFAHTNRQPWRFVVMKGPEARAALAADMVTDDMEPRRMHH